MSKKTPEELGQEFDEMTKGFGEGASASASACSPVRAITMHCQKCGGDWVSPENAKRLIAERDEARRLATELHAMGADGQGLPPLPWENGTSEPPEK